MSKTLDELKATRARYLEWLEQQDEMLRKLRSTFEEDQRIAENIISDYKSELADLARAIAALEAPAQPLDELRSVPGAEEEVRDQSEEADSPIHYEVTAHQENPYGYSWKKCDTLQEAEYEYNGYAGSKRTKDARIDVFVAGALSHTLTQYVAPEPAPHIVEDDWTPTVQPAEITVADLDKLATKASTEERAEMEGDAPEIPAGFTKWEGGECPVDQNVVVRILYRDGVYEDHPAGDVSWSNHGFGETIIVDVLAYRILEAPAPEQYASVEIEPGPYDAAVEKGAITQDEVLDATELPQVTIDKVPPTAEVIRDQDGRAKFALFSGQTHEVVSGSGNPDADFWAQTLHPKPKVDA